MRRAILLGLLHGPTEMAPVSSSAHTILAGRLCDRRAGRGSERRETAGGRGGRERGPDAAARAKSFEVALHAGTALALAPLMAGRLKRSLARLGAGGQPGGIERVARAGATVSLCAAPAALAGWLAERPIERRLGGPRQVAFGLAAGATAMALADRRPQLRTLEQAGLADGLAIGLAQAAALVPGVSRRGASLAAARMRGFRRGDSDELSWLAALPVIAGAVLLKGGRLLAARHAARAPGSRRAGARGGGEHARDPQRSQRSRDEQTPAMIAGAGASFASTLLSGLLLLRGGLDRAPLAPFAAYRFALAAVVLRNAAQDGTLRDS